MTTDVPRTPPRAVLTQLRQEVHFGCPIPRCRRPYLTWHHFDPPWRFEHHHRPEGMIALCREHADKADNGAYTDDYLRSLKAQAGPGTVKGSLDWMRRTLLARVGGSFYYEVSTILQIGRTRCVWFNRDSNNYLLINFRMPSLVANHRLRIRDNYWNVDSEAANEIICPPGGRTLDIQYQNSDRIHFEFTECASADQLNTKYPQRDLAFWQQNITFPVTVFELWESVSGTSLSLGPHVSQFGNGSIQNGFFKNIGGAAIHIGVDTRTEFQLFGQQTYGAAFIRSPLQRSSAHMTPRLV